MPGSSPNWATGYVPPASEWNTWWGNKADFGAGGQIPSVANFAALRLATSTSLASTLCFVLGGSTTADGAEGIFEVSSDVTSADNGGTIIVDASGRRQYRASQTPYLNIRWFLGAGDGVTDNATPLTKALTALPAGGGMIIFPPGKYKFGSAPTFTVPSGKFSVTIAGCGADVTEFYWPLSTSGVTIACSSATHSVHFRDISFTTGVANGGTPLTLSNSVLEGNIAQSDLTRCTFRGDDGGQATDYWGTALAINGLSNINYNGCLFYGSSSNAGNGVVLQGNASTSPNLSIVHNLTGCAFFNLGIGLEYGTEIQGVSVSQCNFTNGTTGIFLPSSAVNAAGLSVSNSQFNTADDQISCQAPIASIMLNNNIFYVPASHSGLLLSSPGQQHCITGNVFTGIGAGAGASAVGIQVSGANANATITGNVFQTLNIGTDLVGSTSGWTVGTNSYNAVTTKVANPGSNIVGTATD